MDWKIQDEYDGAEFGDVRLGRRLQGIAGRVYQRPGDSIPKAVCTSRELEGTYRFLRHEEVTPGRILAPHFAATRDRASLAGRVIVAHDTTDFHFTTPREGLGRGSKSAAKQVFFGHMALAITADETHQPLGVLGVEAYRWTGRPTRKTTHQTIHKPEDKRSSIRWWRLVERVSREMPPSTTVVHVMDREADQFVLASRMMAQQFRFVIRQNHNRAILDDETRTNVNAVLKTLEGRFSRRVTVSRTPSAAPGKAAASPRMREALLSVRATRVSLCRPKTSPQTDIVLPELLAVNLVHVIEEAPPHGMEPIQWTLITTEPIDTLHDIEAIIDIYRARWSIEEFFKALKTGCAFEKRQLESATTLCNALALYIPIAWSLLRLRNIGRTTPKAPASVALTPLQIQLLQHHPDVHLRPNPTIDDAIMAIARLGGHIRQNGPPGWIVLGRGYEQLLFLERGAHLILATQRCDLS